MATVEFQSAVAMVNATCTCSVLVVMFLMKSPWCSDEGVVPLVRAKLFLSVNGGHSMLPFLLLAVHVET